MKRLISVALAVLMLYPAIGTGARAEAPVPSAASAVLMDWESGRIIYEKNSHERRLIASTTKLMTALVAVEDVPDLQQYVTIQGADTQAEGSSMYLRVGEKLTLEALLYGLLLSSGNDAALAIARFCAGNVDRFVARMNSKAAELGMKDTHFSNPNGLDADDHYSTAADMALLAHEVLNHDILVRIISTRSITLGTRTLTNHNKLLWRYEGCIGMKTGYTQAAGRTLISAARRNGQTLICVTLCDPDDWDDHTMLLDYGFQTFPRQVLAKAGQTFRLTPVAGSLVRFVPVCAAQDLFYPLAEEENVRVKVSIPDRLEAPLEQGDHVGQLTYYTNDQCIGQVDLICGRAVRRNVVAANPFLSRILDFFSRKKGDTFLNVFYPQEFPFP
ncbi:MAG: D-alanyl-D-alanine carboxypeptidase [Intestinimonas sp.]|jgi:D-alanyl-D-alanine carboxypeptidase/D-alanyl-D-alanine carboxypeptidase (penicillin-binding protein 5/6)|nr:D-alanyl-D-alanine carboxypeptidase [Intestinimonas sp.]